jgi:quercetin dioxygenase-like cupin family protein
MNTAENHSSNPIFPKGDPAPADYFTGNAFVKMLLPNENAFNCFLGNVVFEPGCRNNWHSHPGGQLLICTEGVGYYQEKGKAIQLLERGDIVQILPDVIHWHGASPESEFTHIAIITNTAAGGTVWMERVTDEEYSSLVNKEDKQ